MNMQATNPDDPAGPATEPAALPETLPDTLPMYWSVRRELWENRSLWVAPLAAAVMVLFGTFVTSFGLPRRMRTLAALEPLQRHYALAKPYAFVGGFLVAITFIVGFFYCLDALYGERRDRSILFWKSLPVSDRTTVLSKAAIPLVVLPLYVFSVIVATLIVMLLLSSIVLVASGTNPMTLWSELALARMTVILIYGLTVLAIWHAAIYGLL